MTLARQLIITIAVLFAFLLAGNLMIDLVNTRALLSKQMQVHARDAATSVALAASHYARDDDDAGLDTLFNAVADSGYYARIQFVDLEGRVTAAREFPVTPARVPGWFVDLVELPAPTGMAEVSSGWRRLGRVEVISHPGHAYESLWVTLGERLIWFTLSALLVFALAWVGLRVLLSPLRAVERQADAIRHQDFQLNDRPPRTRELNSVVRAMNRMSESLQKLFDSQVKSIQRLREQAYRDGVTGLANRPAFDAYLAALEDDPDREHTGALLIVRVQDLKELNELAGRQAGNEMLRAVGEVCQSEVATFTSALVGRRQGTELAVLMADVEQAEAWRVAERVMEQAATLAADNAYRCPLEVKAGFTYQERIDDSSQLLRDADRALLVADSQPGNQLVNIADHVGESELAQQIRSPSEWQPVVNRVLESGDIRLYRQTVFRAADDEPVGAEIFVYFLEGGREISAGVLGPVLERLGRGEDFDRLVLGKVADLAGDAVSGYLAVNLTVSSLRSPRFHLWLDGFLEAHPRLAERLVLEIPERGLQDAEAAARDLQVLLHRRRARLAVDNFGVQASAFGYLRSLPLTYIKLHRSFTRGIDVESDNQFYVESLLHLVHTRGVDLVVEGVESEAEKRTLRTLGVDCLQGYHLQVPQAVH